MIACLTFTTPALAETVYDSGTIVGNQTNPQTSGSGSYFALGNNDSPYTVYSGVTFRYVRFKEINIGSCSNFKISTDSNSSGWVSDVDENTVFDLGASVGYTTALIILCQENQTDWSIGYSSSTGYYIARYGGVDNGRQFALELFDTEPPSPPEWTSDSSWYSTSAVPASGSTWNPAANHKMVVVPAEEPDGGSAISYDEWTASSPHLDLSVIYQIGAPIAGLCNSDYIEWETQGISSVEVVVRGQGIDDDLMFAFHPNMSVFVDGTDYCIRSSVLNGTHSGVVNYGYASKFTVDFDYTIADLGGSLVWDDVAGGEDTSSVATSASLSFCSGDEVSWYINPICYFLRFLDWLVAPTSWTTYWFNHFTSFASDRLPFGWALAPVREFNDSITNYDCDLPVIDASTLTASTPIVTSFDWQFDFCDFWAGLEQYFSNDYIQFSLKMIIGIAGVAAMVGFARIFF